MEQLRPNAKVRIFVAGERSNHFLLAVDDEELLQVIRIISKNTATPSSVALLRK